MNNYSFDEDLLVELVVAGNVTQAEIAERVGLSQGYVSKVVRGEFRPDLHGRIMAVSRQRLKEALLSGRLWSHAILTKHVRAAMEDGETARKCREFMLSRFLFAPADKDDPPPAEPTIPEAEAGEFYRWKSAQAGGPQGLGPGEA